MRKRQGSIDLVKLLLFILRYVWIVAIAAAVGFGFMYYRAAKQPDMYTSSGTMYVVNANPNMVNYGYTNASDISAAIKLIDTYSVVAKSDRVMDRVLEYSVDAVDEDGNPTTLLLAQKYPRLTPAAVAGSISMNSVNETGMVRVSCTTRDPEMSRDICNAVLAVAPQAIVDVVGAGKAEMVDAAKLPILPNAHGETRQGMTGALAGAAAAAAVLALLFLLNQKVTDAKELTEQYTIPVLTTVKRDKRESRDPGSFRLNPQSPMDVVESYAKLRMNLIYTLADKESHSVLVTSSISGEGKSTISANLAISLATSGKKVLLVDADMRRTSQRTVFHYEADLPGLSNALIGAVSWRDCLLRAEENLDILPAGHLPPNPAELLESAAMGRLLKEMEAQYDMVLMDTPPINIVSDPLALSRIAAGAIFLVRQNYSDHREIRKALRSAEMTGMELLGFVFYGEHVRQGSYYSYRHYKGYYYHHSYDTRDQTENRLDPNTAKMEDGAYESAQNDQDAPAASAGRDDGGHRGRRSRRGEHRTDADGAGADGDGLPVG